MEVIGPQEPGLEIAVFLTLKKVPSLPTLDSVMRRVDVKITEIPLSIALLLLFLKNILT